MTSSPPSSAVNLQGWTIYAVDAHSLIFQVFHALPEMSSPRGEQVGAVFGFTRDMFYLLDQKKPDALLCAFDSPGPTFRHETFAAYKADRGEMPDELATQIPKILDVLSAMRIPVLAVPGYEADDILATVARICHEQQARCYIVTGDKDCRQLISDYVSIYNIRKDQVLDAAGLWHEWGVRPDQVIDFQALVGDKVDGIPGVPTVGPKTAQAWLESYGTLDNLLAHAHEIKGAKGKQLQLAREQALVSRELVRLDTRVPVEPDWQASRVGSFDTNRLGDLFAQFGFRSLGERVSQMAQQESAATWQADYQLINTPDSFDRFVRELAQQRLISIDTETTSAAPRFAELVGYSFAWEPGKAYYLPVRGPAGALVLDPTTTAERLKPILEDPQIAKIGQNLKFDMLVLRSAGIELAGATFDTMLASYLLDAGERNYRLDDLARRYLNHNTIKIEELIGRGKSQLRMDEVPLDQVAEYAAEDADVPLRLYPLLSQRLENEGLDELNETVEVPLISVLAALEYTGIRVDPARLQELSQRFGARLDELEREIEQLAGHPLNIGSPKQLATVLFDELRLPVVKKTKTGPSTDADVLEELAQHHPLPAKIIEYRQYAKLKNTYVDALPLLIHPATGRVHASFNQVVAATGRLSSSDPNLQNIPVRSDEGREIRSAFTPGQPGWKLLAADYSQIELRVLAHYSEDPALCQAFAEDADIHTQVASQVFGVPVDEVTPAMRRGAKAVNFGVIYGQSPFGLARSLGISKEEAAQFINSYFDTYRGVESFIHHTLQGCRRAGHVKTLLGRRRAIEGVREVPVQTDLFDSPGRRQLNLPERTAVNTVIQGSAADLIKLAMLAIHRNLQTGKLAARMLLQIHDELVFEVDSGDVDALAAMVRQEMMGVMTLRVPLKVDIKAGDNWAQCEPWNE